MSCVILDEDAAALICHTTHPQPPKRTPEWATSIPILLPHHAGQTERVWVACGASDTNGT